MKTQHASGPWVAEKHPRGHCGIFQRDNAHQVAEVFDRNTSPEMVEANANLIAAAPELLECLIHLADRDWFQSSLTGEIVCGLDAEKVRNALSKALGQNADSVPPADKKTPKLQHDEYYP